MPILLYEVKVKREVCQQQTDQCAVLISNCAELSKNRVAGALAKVRKAGLVFLRWRVYLPKLFK